MIAQHTPAPWHYAEPFELCKTKERGAIRVRGIGNGVCHVGYASITPANEHEALANAHLIAASPELLAALVALLDWTTANVDSHRMQSLGQIENAARAAIAKAGGAN